MEYIVLLKIKYFSLINQRGVYVNNNKAEKEVHYFERGIPPELELKKTRWNLPVRWASGWDKGTCLMLEILEIEEEGDGNTKIEIWKKNLNTFENVVLKRY